MTILRQYQRDAIDMLAGSIRTGHRAPVLVASTGSGKTRTAAAICERATAKGKRVLFLTPRRGLVYQAERAFVALGIDCGIHMAGEEYDSRHMVDVGSIDTIVARIGKHSAAMFGVYQADILIIDEAHQSVSDVRLKFLRSVLDGEYGPKKIIIGLTASPCVAGGGGLGAVYDDLLVPITMAELMDQGYLCRPRYFAAERPDLSGVKIVAGEYQQAALGAAYATISIMGDIVTNWLRIAPGTASVVFTPTRANAADLVERFIAVGVPAEYVDANTKDDERDAMYARLKSGQTKIICNVGIISLGVDIPEIQTVVMATATKSIAKWMQAVGRALRPADGKAHALIIDHGGMCISKHMGPVEDIIDWSLDAKSNIQDRIAARKDAKKEPKEIVCSQCKTVFKSRRDCPQCGFAMKQKTEALEFYAADLQEITPKKDTAAEKRNRNTSWEEKISFFGQLRQYCRDKGKQEGYAAHKFKARFSVWPNDPRLKNAPYCEVTTETLSWIRAQNIRYAKAKEKAA